MYNNDSSGDTKIVRTVRCLNYYNYIVCSYLSAEEAKREFSKGVTCFRKQDNYYKKLTKIKTVQVTKRHGFTNSHAIMTS